MFPPAGWLLHYQPSWLPSDVMAGVTLAAYAIPVSLAYAALAGLPPQTKSILSFGGLGLIVVGLIGRTATRPET